MKHYFLGLLILVACNPPSLDKESQRLIKEELQNREVIKATDGDILAAAQTLGGKIADTTQKALATELLTALKEKGLIEAIKYCNVQALPISDSLSKEYSASIKRTSLMTRNKNNDPTLIEKEILEAYQFSVNNGQAIGENVQMLGNEEILYTKPIFINNALCLNCHGTPGKDIQEEHHQILKELYQKDEATRYSMGDLRGMWSIRINKSEALKFLGDLK